MKISRKLRFLIDLYRALSHFHNLSLMTQIYIYNKHEIMNLLEYAIYTYEMKAEYN